MERVYPKYSDEDPNDAEPDLMGCLSTLMLIIVIFGFLYLLLKAC